MLKSPEIIVVGIEIAGRLRACAVDLGLLDAGLDGADDAFGHRVLQLKYVLQRTIELFRPKMCAGGCFDQLPADAETTGGLAHAALEHIADTELAADLLDVDGTAFVGEARIARDHEQRSKVRERGDDVVHHAIRKVFLLGIAAHVLKRQYGNGRLVGERERLNRAG